MEIVMIWQVHNFSKLECIKKMKSSLICSYIHKNDNINTQTALIKIKSAHFTDWSNTSYTVYLHKIHSADL